MAIMFKITKIDKFHSTISKLKIYKQILIITVVLLQFLRERIKITNCRTISKSIKCL